MELNEKFSHNEERFRFSVWNVGFEVIIFQSSDRQLDACLIFQWGAGENSANGKFEVLSLKCYFPKKTT